MKKFVLGAYASAVYDCWNKDGVVTNMGLSR